MLPGWEPETPSPFPTKHKPIPETLQRPQAARVVVAVRAVNLRKAFNRLALEIDWERIRAEFAKAVIRAEGAIAQDSSVQNCPSSGDRQTVVDAGDPRIQNHSEFNEEKQACLDFKNAEHSWSEMEENPELKFKRDAITTYATKTGQTNHPSKPGRHARPSNR